MITALYRVRRSEAQLTPKLYYDRIINSDPLTRKDCPFPWVMKIPWRREWLPTPVFFLLGEFHEQRSLMGYSPWGHKESDTTEWLTVSLFHFSLSLSAWAPSEFCVLFLFFFFFLSYEVENQLTDRKATKSPLHINFLFLLNSFALLPKVQRVLGRANVYFVFSIT